jgi:hypothetical protein
MTCAILILLNVRLTSPESCYEDFDRPCPGSAAFLKLEACQILIRRLFCCFSMGYKILFASKNFSDLLISGNAGLPASFA